MRYLYQPFPIAQSHHQSSLRAIRGADTLDQLLESTVDGRADFDALVELDGFDSALADAFGCEFEFL